jgi:ketosteroid isomerase-like protein
MIPGMKQFVIAVFPMLLLARVTSVSADEVKNIEQITKIEREWSESFVKHDASVPQRVEAEDFTMVDPDGKLLNKAEDIKNMTGDVVFTASKVDDLKVRIFGDTAVAVGVSSVKGHDKKNDISGQYPWTDTFVKQNGEWRAVASQVTFVKK